MLPLTFRPPFPVFREDCSNSKKERDRAAIWRGASRRRHAETVEESFMIAELS